MFDIEYLKSQTVLFVEDEELARDVLAKILSKIFKNVLTAANGLEGLEKFKESKSSNEIDLIISDINMPIMNGLDMLEKIREIDSTIPVIFVTARNETNNILRAVDLNVTNYIIKPLQTDVLLKKIADACEKKYISKQLNEKKEELENYL
jgi:YesN/AraC family two-component response regulator